MQALTIADIAEHGLESMAEERESLDFDLSQEQMRLLSRLAMHDDHDNNRMPGARTRSESLIFIPSCSIVLA